MQLKIWGAIIVASLAWGTTGVATRAALNAGVPEFALVTVRSALAGLLIAAFLVVRHGGLGFGTGAWAPGLVLGVTNLAIPFVLLTFAYANAGAGFVGFLIALIPLVTAVLAHFLLPDERLHVGKVVALLIALSGVAFLLLSGDSGLAEGGRPFLAFVLAMSAVLSIGWASIFAKRRAHSYDTIQITGTQFVIGAVVLVATMLVVEGIPAAFSTWGWMLLLYLTIPGTIVPFLAYYWLLRHVSATKASLMAYLVPLVALVSGIALIDEQLQMGIGVGGLLILVGVVLTDRAERIPARV